MKVFKQSYTRLSSAARQQESVNTITSKFEFSTVTGAKNPSAKPS